MLSPRNGWPRDWYPRLQPASRLGIAHLVPPLLGEGLQTDLSRRNRPRLVIAARESGPDPFNQCRVLGIDLAVDPPVEVPGDPHFARIVGETVGDFADQRLPSAQRQHLHEIDLIRINVE